MNAITSINNDNKKIWVKNNQLREDSSIKNFENVEYASITYVFDAH